MIQPRELAPIIGRMVVSGQVLEGDRLADYLQLMPYDNLVSLIEDMTLLGIITNDNFTTTPN